MLKLCSVAVVYGGSSYSGKGLYNMWTASSSCNTKVTWKFKVNFSKEIVGYRSSPDVFKS